MPLTDIEVRAAKTATTPKKLFDGGGLYLRIDPKGSKLWRMAYRFEGKERTLSFGAYPGVSLKDARTRRDEARALLAGAVDPGQQRKLEKLARAVSNATTFKGLADEYIDKLKRDGRAPATLEKVSWLLSFATLGLGERPIADIKASEVLAVLKPIETRGNLETARRLRATIGSVFRFAIATARAEADPTAFLKGALTSPKVKHRPAITDPVALGGLLRAIDGFSGQPSTIAALKLLPLVFSRPGELRMAEWSEFDIDKADMDHSGEPNKKCVESTTSRSRAKRWRSCGRYDRSRAADNCCSWNALLGARHQREHAERRTSAIGLFPRGSHVARFSRHRLHPAQ